MTNKEKKFKFKILDHMSGMDSWYRAMKVIEQGTQTGIKLDCDDVISINAWDRIYRLDVNEDGTINIWENDF